MRPFWLTRTITGLAIIAGYCCLVSNMVLTARAGRVEHVDTEYAPYERTEDGGGGRWSGLALSS